MVWPMAKTLAIGIWNRAMVKQKVAPVSARPRSSVRGSSTTAKGPPLPPQGNQNGPNHAGHIGADEQQLESGHAGRGELDEAVIHDKTRRGGEHAENAGDLGRKAHGAGLGESGVAMFAPEVGAVQWWGVFHPSPNSFGEGPGVGTAGMNCQGWDSLHHPTPAPPQASSGRGEIKRTISLSAHR